MNNNTEDLNDAEMKFTDNDIKKHGENIVYSCNIVIENLYNFLLRKDVMKIFERCVKELDIVFPYEYVMNDIHKSVLALDYKLEVNIYDTCERLIYFLNDCIVQYEKYINDIDSLDLEVYNWKENMMEVEKIKSFLRNCYNRVFFIIKYHKKSHWDNKLNCTDDCYYKIQEYLKNCRI